MSDGVPAYAMYPPRVVSGMQPTAAVHLGHYFGALKQHLEFQHEYPGESFFLIADYHSLTRDGDAKSIRAATTGLATAYLALGLDPNKAVLYRQSDVPQTLELYWILSRFVTVSELREVPTYTQAAGETSRTAALLAFPVLMAADVLGMRATAVPVGKEQDFCIELLRDMGKGFNQRYGVPFFPVPTARFSPSPTVRGLDGKKMHNGSGNTIGLFDNYATLRRSVGAIRTDTRGRGEAKDPDRCTVFHLFSLVAPPEEVEQMRADYGNGGLSYDEAKRKLVGALQERFAEESERYEELRARPGFVEDVLREGYRAAAEQIDITVDHVRQMVGLTY